MFLLLCLQPRTAGVHRIRAAFGMGSRREAGSNVQRVYNVTPSSVFFKFFSNFLSFFFFPGPFSPFFRKKVRKISSASRNVLLPVPLLETGKKGKNSPADPDICWKKIPSGDILNGRRTNLFQTGGLYVPFSFQTPFPLCRDAEIRRSLSCRHLQRALSQ